MTEPATPPPSAAGGDPTKSDDHDTPGLRSDLGGSAPDASVTSPAPGGDGQLGSASGGYGTSSGFGGSGGGPDGEDVDVNAGPGPQTDWMRSAPGAGRSGPADDERDATQDRGDAAGE